MPCSTTFLSASEAAARVGVTTKALRLYEQRGLLTPDRTAAGYRVYGPEHMVRAREIADLRALGFSLAQVACVLGGNGQSLASTLATHATALEAEICKLVKAKDKVHGLRADLARNQVPSSGGLARVPSPPGELNVAFQLPWPWGGEWFELLDIRPINYIVGPLGSGKTRLAMRLAETLPKATFLSLERSKDDNASITACLTADPLLGSRVDQALAGLIGEGATESSTLITLLIALEREELAVLVVDMVEQGLDHPTQEALATYLRQRANSGAHPLFLMTRSSAILDLTTIGSETSIILCPANHCPPTQVAPYPGAPGYEAVATCLASPEVRARTTGTIAWRPEAA